MKPAPPPRDADLTRHAILLAALELFAEEGFETVGVRSIGARAGVDPALINRYFGGKDELFVEVIRSGSADWRRLWGERGDFPRLAVQEVLHGPKCGSILRGLIVMMRSSGSEKARRLIDEALGASAFEELEDWVGGADADVRARLLMGVLAGMAFARDLSSDFDLPEERADILSAHLAGVIERVLNPAHA